MCIVGERNLWRLCYLIIGASLPEAKFSAFSIIMSLFLWTPSFSCFITSVRAGRWHCLSTTPPVGGRWKRRSAEPASPSGHSGFVWQLFPQQLNQVFSQRGVSRHLYGLLHHFLSFHFQSSVKELGGLSPWRRWRGKWARVGWAPPIIAPTMHQHYPLNGRILFPATRSMIFFPAGL